MSRMNSDFEFCPNCGSRDGWRPEHAHQRCRDCGYIEPCCEGAACGD